MRRATALHPVHRTLRIVTLEMADGSGSVEAASITLDVPFSPETLSTKSERISESLAEAAASVSEPVALALPGGFFQARKVPLEVADAAGRNSQIDWEIEQATGSPRTSFDASYFSFGSAAVWFSVRRSVRDQLDQVFAAGGCQLGSVYPEPLALFHAARLAGVTAARRRSAILLGHAWSSYVVFEGDRLTGAEAIYHGEEHADDGAAHSPSTATGAATRRWLLDRGARPARDMSERIYLCGVLGADGASVDHASLGDRAEPLDPFSRFDTAHIPSPSEFSAAAGAAYEALSGSNP